MTAALNVLAEAAPATAEALWQRLASELFTDQMLRLGDAEAGAFAAMTNMSGSPAIACRGAWCGSLQDRTAPVAGRRGRKRNGGS